MRVPVRLYNNVSGMIFAPSLFFAWFLFIIIQLVAHLNLMICYGHLLDGEWDQLNVPLMKIYNHHQRSSYYVSGNLIRKLNS
jgi:hypothetical protein